ncbi:MAG: CAP domain-containing protein [Pyrinomonadaceae bacterium]|nr:CAP domain-containing protein [Pyrinomonadaceae bacterium]
MRRLFTLLMLAALFGAFTVAVSAQKKCGKKEDDEKYEQTFRNATDKTITVKVIDENCNEHPVTIKSGKAGKYESVYSGYLFVADIGGETKEFTAAYSNYVITIGAHESDDHRESFLQTVNHIRQGNNLSPMEFDDKLNQAAQWFADLLAKYEADSAGHDAVAAGGSEYASMQDVGQRATHFGWKEKTGVAEVVAGDNLLNLPKGAIGGGFALGWSSSTTHYAPFFDIGEQKFNRVGFGIAPSKKTKDKYYAVAVFGTVE